MRKILLSLLLMPAISFASSLDMSNLKCRDMKITASTTLKQVQSTCLIKQQKKHDGMFEVKFINDATGKSVKCDFASQDPSAVVNGCR